jgi:hypothetical protein
MELAFSAICFRSSFAAGETAFFSLLSKPQPLNALVSPPPQKSGTDLRQRHNKNALFLLSTEQHMSCITYIIIGLNCAYFLDKFSSFAQPLCSYLPGANPTIASYNASVVNFSTPRVA